MKLVVILALLGGLTQAQVKIIAQQYSEEARIAGLEGPVLLTGTAAADGSVADIKVTRPLGLGLDELAVQAVAQHKPEGYETGPTVYWVSFALPEKQSHWHLAGVEFKTPPGATRPTFAQADYPVGPGIGVAAYDEAQLLTVIGRAAEATLAFDIDEQGYPGNFKVVDASEATWGPQAAMLVRTWRFHPGTRGGIPVVVPCTVNLIWGPADFTSGAIKTQVERIVDPPPPLPPPNPPPMDELILSKIEPEYTIDARQAGVQGQVVMSLTVDREGKPAKVTLVRTNVTSNFLPDSALIDNATDALRKWRFQPQMVNGKAIPYSLTVETTFLLSGVTSTLLYPPKPVSPTK